MLSKCLSKLLFNNNNLSLISISFGTAISAAADGVGATLSATKFVSVTSVSCPTAAIIGILELNIALTTISSLNAQRSSKDPPPLPTIITSTLFLLFSHSLLKYRL